MPVYMLFLRESKVKDAEAMKTYSGMNRSGPPNPRLKPLVVYGEMQAIEGQAPDGIVLLEFPTEADALAWYNSPAYQAAIPFRQKGADYRAVMVKGL